MGTYNMAGTLLSTAFDIEGESIPGVYDIDGEYSPFAVNPEPIDYTAYTQQTMFSYPGGNYDGGAVYGGIFFQLIANDKMNLFDLATGQLITGNIPIQSGHGNAASFSSEKYADTDEFPLLYISTNSNPARINVCRVTRLSSALVKSYVFPLDRTGYYANHVYDEDRHIMYMVGYTEDNYSTDDDGANKTLVSLWDMTDLTDNGDGTFTPAFISSYERPYIYVMQDAKLHDGLLWLASGWWDSYVSCIFAMHPDTGAIEHTIMLGDTEEIEGIDWVYDSERNRYCLIVTQQGHVQPYSIVFSRIDFAGVSTLPDGYQRLPYIVGNGTASNFDTGVSGGTDNLRIECSFNRNVQANYLGFFGNYVDEPTDCWRIIASTITTRVYTSSNSRASLSRTINFDTAYVGNRLYAMISKPRNVIAIEGAKAWQNISNLQSGNANSGNIDIGNANVATGITSETIRTKWYFFRIWNGSTLIRDYIPCKRILDGKVGFYDTVNNEFSSSSGGAEFEEPENNVS